MRYHRLFWVYIGETGLPSSFEELFDGVVPVTQGSLDKLDSLSSQDVVLFDGGVDIDPAIYGETPHPFSQPPNKVRDEYERIVFRRAQGVGAGCLGVCRGAQLLCALSGGSLIQHVSGHEGPTGHIIITKEGKEIIASGDHHQMMFPYDAPEFQVLAWAENIGKFFCEYGKIPLSPIGVRVPQEPEVVWFPHTKSLCIQPHPEWMRNDMTFPLYCRELVAKLFLNSRSVE